MDMSSCDVTLTHDEFSGASSIPRGPEWCVAPHAPVAHGCMACNTACPARMMSHHARAYVVCTRLHFRCALCGRLAGLHTFRWHERCHSRCGQTLPRIWHRTSCARLHELRGHVLPTHQWRHSRCLADCCRYVTPVALGMSEARSWQLETSSGSRILKQEAPQMHNVAVDARWRYVAHAYPVCTYR